MPKLFDFSKRYAVESSLGRGGTGEVFKVWDRECQRHVALKIIHAEISASPRIRHFFNREAKAFSLLHHPNIVELFDYGMNDKEQVYIAMELVRGVSFFQLGDARLPLATILDLSCQILDALSYAHARGLVHCDLKPENVLISLRDDRLWAQLVDFGLASISSDTNDQSSIRFGTPAYMAPEQILVRDRLIGPCTDIYATGTILFEALTGKLPFAGKTPRETMKLKVCNPIPNVDWRPHLEGLKPRVKDQLRDILQTALAKSPWCRFISSEDFKKKLREIEASKEPLDGEILALFADQKIQSSAENPAMRSDSQNLSDKIRAVKAQEDSGLLWSPERSPQTRIHAQKAIDGFASESFDTYNAPGALFQTSYERFLSEFVRPKELAILTQDAKQALQGRGCLRIISGGFGFGKTKLIKCTSARALTGKFYIITCASPLYHTILRKRLTPDQISANLTRQMLTQLQTICDMHAEDDAPTRDFAIEDELHHIATAPNVVCDNWQPILDAVQSRLEYAASTTSIAILIDDLQRCSAPFYQLLTRIQQKITSLPVVVFITHSPCEPATPIEIADLAKRPPFQGLFRQQLRLEEIPRHTLCQMIKSCWKLDENTSQKIAAASFGNPGYATALVQHLSQTSRLQKTDKDLFGFAPDDDRPLDTPRTITMHFRKKLDEIASTMGAEFEFYREIFIHMSVMGQSITFQELDAYWHLDLDRALAQYGKKAIETWAKLGMLKVNGDEITYTEPWMCQAAIAELSSRQIKMLKSQAAMALVDCYAQPTPEQSWRIAQYWREAGDTVSFVQCGYDSALHAFNRGKYRFALERFEATVRIYDALDEKGQYPNDILRAIDWPSCFILAAEAALFLDLTSVYDAYTSRLKRWINRTSEGILLAHLQKLSAKKHLRDDNYTRAIEFANHARESFKICHASLEAMRSTLLLGDAEYRDGQTSKALAHYSESLEAFITLDAQLDIANAQVRLAHLQWSSGHPQVARELVNEAILKFDECQAFPEKLHAQFDSECVEFLRDPDDNRLRTLSQIAQQFEQLDDPKEKLYSIDKLMIVHALHGDWKAVHDLGSQTPSRSPFVSTIHGTLACLNAIEHALNDEHDEANDDLTMAIANFGPRNRRARAWCHTLSGLHAAQTAQIETSQQAFERAINDFNAMQEQHGIASAQLGLCILAAATRQYENAYHRASECMQRANELELPIHALIASAIGIWAIVQDEKFERIDAFKNVQVCLIPQLIRQYWMGFMTTTLDLVANNPKAHEAAKGIEALIKTMKAREVQKNAMLYPSVEISF